MAHPLSNIVDALLAPAPEGGGVPARLAQVLQWIAAFSIAEPILLATLGGFTEPFAHLFRPAGLQLLVQLPGALCLGVAAHYLRLSSLYTGPGRTLRSFVAFWFAFFGGWLLALGADVLLRAL